MPKAMSFKDRDELVAALRRTRWTNALKRAHAKEEDLGPLTAIYASVTRSTYRAFRSHGNHTPSSVFRTWASRELYSCNFRKLRNVRSNHQYRAWAIDLAQSLSNTWHKDLREKLTIPKALKLINLLAKGLCVVSPLWPTETKTVIKHLDIPLDQFSLRPLTCIEDLSGLRRASMGYVQTLETYEDLQSAIRDVCDEARVPPIAYDLLAWDGAHTKN
jgi:hypothetical protein